MGQNQSKTESFTSESSIFVHPISKPKKDQLTLPTGFLIVVLIVSLIVLKLFIYISDKKRHGK